MTNTNNQNPSELDFDQTERITARLRDLVRGYPKGLGLVKEFLQNADDAGASELRVIYDRRHHPGSFPQNPGMEVALKPALLFLNNASFSDADFQNIQNIGGQLKTFDAARTGRFGQGFNTCYSVTDHPSLLTGDRIAWFDPHHRVHLSNKTKNAYAWKLSVAVDYWPDWIRTFKPAASANSQPETGLFRGTVFRLPLRSADDVQTSEITNEAFTEEDFNGILEEIRHIGPALLIFLRSVTSFEIREIGLDGVDHLRYWIETDNKTEVDHHRKGLREVVKGDLKKLVAFWLNSTDCLPVVQFDHNFLVCDDGTERQERWAVTSGLFRGTDNHLLTLAQELLRHKEKAIPWAGAAVRREPPPGTDTCGGLSCFLPLPERTDWPVWLHGGFDLDSSRHGITRNSDVGETTRARYNWNLALMKHAAGPAWAKLMQRIQGPAQETNTPYELWPVPKNYDEIDAALLKGFYQIAAGFAVIRGRNNEGYRWCRLDSGVINLPSEQWHKRLTEPFLAQRLTICDPWLPEFVQRGFQEIKQKLPTVDQPLLRKLLREKLGVSDISCPLENAPSPMLQKREWIYALTEFCADGDWKNLRQLPLALLADDRLHTFTACGTLYVVAKEERVLIEPLAWRLLDTEYQQAVGLNNPVEEIPIVDLSLEGLISCVQELLKKGPPEPEWLCHFFDYLSRCSQLEVQNHEEDLKDLELIPDQNGAWHCMGFIETPLIAVKTNTKLHESLTKLGISLFQGSERLLQAVSRFALEHQGFIWSLTPNDLADNLKCHAEDTTLNEALLDDRNILNPLLDFLASEKWSNANDERLPLLRQVRLLPTKGGHRVAAQDDNIYISGGFSPPFGFEDRQYRLLDTGPGERWRGFFEALSVPQLDGREFVENVLLPAFEESTREQCCQYLIWLRDEFHLVERDLDKDSRQQLKDKIRRTPILPIQNGQLEAPQKVYRPDAKEPRELLGNIACIPDENYFGSKQDDDLWRKFFIELDLPDRPLAKDIYAAIVELCKESQEKGGSAVRDQLSKLRTHVEKRWEELANQPLQSNTFAKALSELAWLNAISNDKRGNYAACNIYPDKLWKASELVAPRLAHLVASEYPVLDGSEFSSEMSKALGLRTDVTIIEVIRHFEKVRALPRGQDTKDTTILDAVKEIFRFFGQKQNIPNHWLNHWSHQLDVLKKQKCVYVAIGKWRNPDRCFFGPLPFKTNRINSLQNSELLSGPGSSEIYKGLERIGVRSHPEHDTWLQLLRDLAGEYANQPLSATDLTEARCALRQLRSAPDEWLRHENILVPLSNGRLEKSQSAFIPDHPRLKREDCKMFPPLIEDNEDAIDIGNRAGARSLRGSVIERLKEKPPLTQNQKQLAFSDQIQQRIHSVQFENCLRRLVQDETLERGGSVEVLTSDPFDSVKSLQIRIASSLWIESVLEIDGEESVIFETDNPSFLDRENTCLWLLNKISNNRQVDEVVDTLCDLVGLTNQLRLRRLIDFEPELMDPHLDEEGVVRLESRRLDLNNYANVPDDTGEISEADNFDNIDDIVDDTQEVDGCLGHDEVDTNKVRDESQFDTEWDNEEKAAGDKEEEDTADPTPDRPPHERGKGRLPEFPSVPGGSPPSASTKPGHGSTRSATKPDMGTEPKKQERLRSYLHPNPQNDYDTGESESEAKEIGDRGELIVKAWEEKRGWRANLMPRNHEGYDIESRQENEIRYIEVKAINGPWGIRGVGLTYPQYKAAIEHREAWWLYVVENAMTPERAIVHPIPNPFLKITEFRFDDGWRALAEELVPKTSLKPEVGDRYQRGSEEVEILKAKPNGTLWRVTIKRPNGETKTVTWSPNWQRV